LEMKLPLSSAIL